MPDEKSDGGGDMQAMPHAPEYALAKAREMLTRADQAGSEEDRQAFRALAEQWERLAKVAKRPHISPGPGGPYRPRPKAGTLLVPKAGEMAGALPLKGLGGEAVPGAPRTSGLAMLLGSTLPKVG